MGIFIDILGYAALAFLGLSYFMKKRIGIIILQVIANALFISHYVLLGIYSNGSAFSAAFCNIGQLIMLFVFYIAEKKSFKKLVPAIFIFVIYGGLLIYGFIELFVNGNYVSLLSIIASTVGISGFFSNKKFVIKLLGMASDAIWLTYGIFISDLPTIINNSILFGTTMISLIIGIVHYRSAQKDLLIKQAADEKHKKETEDIENV